MNFYIKVSAIVLKVTPGLYKGFFWAQFKSSISELSVGEMFNCTPSWNWKEAPILMVLRLILKGILKVYFRLISSLMESQSNFGELVIKYKIELKLFLFFTSETQNIWCIAHSVYCSVWGKRKVNKFIPDKKYRYNYPSEHFRDQFEKVLSQISGLRTWCPSEKFGREMNLKGFLYLVLLDRLQIEGWGKFLY